MTGRSCVEQLFACHRHPLCTGLHQAPFQHFQHFQPRSASRRERHHSKNHSVLIFPWPTRAKACTAPENKLSL